MDSPICTRETAPGSVCFCSDCLFQSIMVSQPPVVNNAPLQFQTPQLSTLEFPNSFDQSFACPPGGKHPFPSISPASGPSCPGGNPRGRLTIAASLPPTDNPFGCLPLTADPLPTTIYPGNLDDAMVVDQELSATVSGKKAFVNQPSVPEMGAPKPGMFDGIDVNTLDLSNEAVCGIPAGPFVDMSYQPTAVSQGGYIGGTDPLANLPEQMAPFADISALPAMDLSSFRRYPQMVPPSCPARVLTDPVPPHYVHHQAANQAGFPSGTVFPQVPALAMPTMANEKVVSSSLKLTPSSVVAATPRTPQDDGKCGVATPQYR